MAPSNSMRLRLKLAKSRKRSEQTTTQKTQEGLQAVHERCCCKEAIRRSRVDSNQDANRPRYKKDDMDSNERQIDCDGIIGIIIVVIATIVFWFLTP